MLVVPRDSVYETVAAGCTTIAAITGDSPAPNRIVAFFGKTTTPKARHCLLSHGLQIDVFLIVNICCGCGRAAV